MAVEQSVSLEHVAPQAVPQVQTVDVGAVVLEHVVPQAVPFIPPSPQVVEQAAALVKVFEMNKETLTATERESWGILLSMQENWATHVDVGGLLACKQAGEASTFEQEVQDKATKRKAKRRFANH